MIEIGLGSQNVVTGLSALGKGVKLDLLKAIGDCFALVGAWCSRKTGGSPTPASLAILIIASYCLLKRKVFGA